MAATGPVCPGAGLKATASSFPTAIGRRSATAILPLSNLDAKLRVQMRTEIKALHQRLNTTITYVTHDQVEAMTTADKIVLLNDGVVQQVGTPLEV